MKLGICRSMLPCAVLLLLAVCVPSLSAQFKAGIARVDITPALADLPAPYNAIQSNLYVRTLVVENSGKRAVIVVGDLPTIALDVLADLNKRIAEASGAPVENVVMSVSHTHNAVRLDNNPVGMILPGSAKITKITSDQIIDSVKLAVADLRPARAGYATGTAHLFEPRPEPGVSPALSAKADRSIGVLKVESESGEPMAFLLSNGPEPVIGMSIPTQISADLAGAMSRHIEKRFNDKVIAMFTLASPPELAINSWRKKSAAPNLADPVELMTGVGAVLGEEVMDILPTIKMKSDLPISGAVTAFTCPGKKTSPFNNPNFCSDDPGSKLPRCVFTEQEFPPVRLQMSMLRLGDLAMITSDTNIAPSVWQQVRDQAPPALTPMLVVLVYGPMHFVISDAEYPSNSYQATATMAKRGCAEKEFVGGALKMMQAVTAK